MTLLNFRKPPAAVEPDLSPDGLATPPDLDAEAKKYYEARGVKFKDRSISHAIIREDAPDTFRVMCLDCLTQYDLFGKLAPADATGECQIVQAILEHLGRCSDRKNPMNTYVYQNKNTPQMYKLTAEWMPT